MFKMKKSTLKNRCLTKDAACQTEFYFDCLHQCCCLHGCLSLETGHITTADKSPTQVLKTELPVHKNDNHTRILKSGEARYECKVARQQSNTSHLCNERQMLRSGVIGDNHDKDDSQTRKEKYVDLPDNKSDESSESSKDEYHHCYSLEEKIVYESKPVKENAFEYSHKLRSHKHTKIVDEIKERDTVELFLFENKSEETELLTRSEEIVHSNRYEETDCYNRSEQTAHSNKRYEEISDSNRTQEIVHSKTSLKRAHSNSPKETVRSDRHQEKVHSYRSQESAHSNRSEEKSHSNRPNEIAHSKTSLKRAHSNSPKETAYSDRPQETIHSDRSQESAHSNRYEERSHSNKPHEILQSKTYLKRAHSYSPKETAYSDRPQETVRSKKCQESAHSNRSEERSHSKRPQEIAHSNRFQEKTHRYQKTAHSKRCEDTVFSNKCEDTMHSNRSENTTFSDSSEKNAYSSRSEETAFPNNSEDTPHSNRSEEMSHSKRKRKYQVDAEARVKQVNVYGSVDSRIEHLMTRMDEVISAERADSVNIHSRKNMINPNICQAKENKNTKKKRKILAHISSRRMEKKKIVIPKLDVGRRNKGTIIDMVKENVMAENECEVKVEEVDRKDRYEKICLENQKLLHKEKKSNVSCTGMCEQLEIIRPMHTQAFGESCLGEKTQEQKIKTGSSRTPNKKNSQRLQYKCVENMTLNKGEMHAECPPVPNDVSGCRVRTRYQITIGQGDIISDPLTSLSNNGKLTAHNKKANTKLSNKKIKDLKPKSPCFKVVKHVRKHCGFVPRLVRPNLNEHSNLNSLPKNDDVTKANVDDMQCDVPMVTETCIGTRPLTTEKGRKISTSAGDDEIVCNFSHETFENKLNKFRNIFKKKIQEEKETKFSNEKIAIANSTNILDKQPGTVISDSSPQKEINVEREKDITFLQLLLNGKPIEDYDDAEAGDSPDCSRKKIFNLLDTNEISEKKAKLGKKVLTNNKRKNKNGIEKNYVHFHGSKSEESRRKIIHVRVKHEMTVNYGSLQSLEHDKKTESFELMSEAVIKAGIDKIRNYMKNGMNKEEPVSSDVTMPQAYELNSSDPAMPLLEVMAPVSDVHRTNQLGSLPLETEDIVSGVQKINKLGGLPLEREDVVLGVQKINKLGGIPLEKEDTVSGMQKINKLGGLSLEREDVVLGVQKINKLGGLPLEREDVVLGVQKINKLGGLPLGKEDVVSGVQKINKLGGLPLEKEDAVSEVQKINKLGGLPLEEEDAVSGVQKINRLGSITLEEEDIVSDTQKTINLISIPLVVESTESSAQRANKFISIPLQENDTVSTTMKTRCGSLSLDNEDAVLGTEMINRLGSLPFENSVSSAQRSSFGSVPLEEEDSISSVQKINRFISVPVKEKNTVSIAQKVNMFGSTAYGEGGSVFGSQETKYDLEEHYDGFDTYNSFSSLVRPESLEEDNMLNVKKYKDDDNILRGAVQIEQKLQRSTTMSERIVHHLMDRTKSMSTQGNQRRKIMPLRKCKEFMTNKKTGMMAKRTKVFALDHFMPAHGQNNNLEFIKSINGWPSKLQNCTRNESRKILNSKCSSQEDYDKSGLCFNHYAECKKYHPKSGSMGMDAIFNSEDRIMICEDEEVSNTDTRDNKPDVDLNKTLQSDHISSTVEDEKLSVLTNETSSSLPPFITFVSQHVEKESSDSKVTPSCGGLYHTCTKPIISLSCCNTSERNIQDCGELDSQTKSVVASKSLVDQAFPCSISLYGTQMKHDKKLSEDFSFIERKLIRKNKYKSASSKNKPEKKRQGFIKKKNYCETRKKKVRNDRCFVNAPQNVEGSSTEESVSTGCQQIVQTSSDVGLLEPNVKLEVSHFLSEELDSIIGPEWLHEVTGSDNSTLEITCIDTSGEGDFGNEKKDGSSPSSNCHRGGNIKTRVTRKCRSGVSNTNGQNSKQNSNWTNTRRISCPKFHEVEPADHNDRYKVKLKTVQFPKLGQIVWGKFGRRKWWPAIVVHGDLVNIKPAERGSSWLFWFGDHRISKIQHDRIVLFVSSYQSLKTKTSSRILQVALQESIKLCAVRCGLKADDMTPTDLSFWADSGFLVPSRHTQDEYLFDPDPGCPLPEFVVEKLKEIGNI